VKEGREKTSIRKENPILEPAIFQGDVVDIARDMVGKILVREEWGRRVSGRIVETEAYRGRDDRACHAYGYRRTPRTSPMFEAGGTIYVYVCYGIHHLLNLVCGPVGEPNAVLIRALEPLEGFETAPSSGRLASGPGKLCKALGIDTRFSGLPLGVGTGIWLEDDGSCPWTEVRTRIGVDYAGEDAFLPWRFLAKDSRFVSRP
jgi:DNA-3-methyladenine glycosylase